MLNFIIQVWKAFSNPHTTQKSDSVLVEKFVYLSTTLLFSWVILLLVSFHQVRTL